MHQNDRASILAFAKRMELSVAWMELDMLQHGQQQMLFRSLRGGPWRLKLTDPMLVRDMTHRVSVRAWALLTRACRGEQATPHTVQEAKDTARDACFAWAQGANA